jgi:hypothetical protein
MGSKIVSPIKEMRGPEKIDKVFETVRGRNVAPCQFGQYGFAVGEPTVQQRLFPGLHVPLNLSDGTITLKGERHDAFLGAGVEMLRRFREMRVAEPHRHNKHEMSQTEQ